MKKSKTIVSVVTTLVTAMVMTACSSGMDNPVMPDGGAQQVWLPERFELVGHEALFVQHTNDFTFNMMRQMNAMYKDSSLVTSPLSTASVLGMLDNAAEGDARQQIEQVLGFDGTDVQAVNNYFYKLLVLAPQVDVTTKLNMANAIYVNKPRELQPAFVESLDCFYHAKADTLDFRDKGAVDTINNWCARQTNGMIPEMLKELSPSTASVILNAIYFNGKWAAPFNKKKTRQATFTTDGGVKRSVSMMSMTTESADYFANSTLQALRMDYGNGSYSMTILLPCQGKTVGDIVAVLESSVWDELQSGLKQQIVDIELPRFTVETADEEMENLLPLLRSMGVSRIFEQGNLPLMFKRNHPDVEDAYIGSFRQKAKIEVTEEGTEGAAVTEVEIADGEGDESGIGMPVFKADHPFVYVISERTTGVIFFIGIYRG